MVAPPDVYAAEALTALVQTQRVSAAVLTPTVLSSLERDPLDGLDTVITVGEACPPELVVGLGTGPVDVQRLRPHRDHHLGAPAARGWRRGSRCPSAPRSRACAHWCWTPG